MQSPKPEAEPKIVFATFKLDDGREMALVDGFRLVPKPDMSKYKNSVVVPPPAWLETD